jgi:hypothetical protein
MNDGAFWELGELTDLEVQAELARLLAYGSRTEARVIAHLAAVEERRLHLKAGSSSLFDYCCRRLGLSENEAFHRITAARLARRFPAIFGLIERRAIHLSAVCLLRDYLSPANQQQLLEEASGKTKLQVQALIANRFPRADVAATIRKLPTSRVQERARPAASVGSVTPPVELSAPVEDAADDVTQETTPLARASNSGQPPSSSQGPPSTQPSPPVQSPRVAPPPTAAVEPLSPARYRIQLTASAQLKQKLEQAADLLSHSVASGDLAAVIERAVDLLIEKAQKRRFAQTKWPRRGPPSPTEITAVGAEIEKREAPRARRRRHIANDIKRQITARDGLRCAFVGTDGQRCTARRLLQIHHEDPWARGGGDTVDNLAVLCASHNRLLAERDFGKDLVAIRIQAQRALVASRGLQSRGSEDG